MIKSQAELYWVCRTEGFLSYSTRIVVSLKCLLGRLVLFVSTRIFSDVSVVVGFHLEEKYFTLANVSTRD